MSRFSLNIQKFNLISPRLPDSQAWEKWANDPSYLSEEAMAIDVSFLPPMLRRRLSPFARICFKSAWDITQDRSYPVIFSSSNGEISRNFSLLHSLSRQEPLSPTAFGLSVHNSLIGQWSIIKKDTSDMTAISCKQDGLEHAFLEAYLMLEQGHQTVLVIHAEESPDISMPDDYMVQKSPFSYAASFLLEKGDQLQLSLNTLSDHESTSNHQGVLYNIQHILQHHKKWTHTLQDYRRQWLWELKHDIEMVA
ncbi:beta-ketoacyl synthase chain length factor [Basilea psittacipulmonis]|uniref:beta-ketoacyl synthase chain length factor n=1 Tax=Basilea psittacipulmonis TaxID=1472345 RepID=UPI000691D3C1|nr:beta-ketoacyl synthase chain length factor [Basilea psittacipulmonis]